PRGGMPSLFTLGPGQRIDAEVSISEACGALAVNTWSFRAAAELDGPWGQGGVFAVRGRVDSNSVPTRVEQPPQAALGVNIRSLAPSTRTDQPSQVEISLQNFGN